jgi:hypothetical protein
MCESGEENDRLNLGRAGGSLSDYAQQAVVLAALTPGLE